MPAAPPTWRLGAARGRYTEDRIVRSTEWRGFTVPTEEENSPAGRAARWAALGEQDAFGGEPEDLGDDLFTDESGVSSDPDDTWVPTQ